MGECSYSFIVVAYCDCAFYYSDCVSLMEGSVALFSRTKEKQITITRRSTG